MKAKDQSRFSIDALRGLAGDKVFARGETYHCDGQVQILTIEPKRVLAQVAGTEDYLPSSPDAAAISVAIAPAPHSGIGESASTWSRWR